MKLRSPLLAILIVILFSVGIGSTMALNLWKTGAEKDPAKITGLADIKGSLEFSLLSQAFSIPLADFLTAFELADKPDAAVRDVEARYGASSDGALGVDSVKLFIALYKNMAFTPKPATRLLPAAAGVLKDKVTAEGTILLEKSLYTAAPTKEAVEKTANVSPTGDRTIKGSTTFGDLFSWGLTKGEIEAVINGPVGASGDTVKSKADERGVEFSAWKTALQAKVDAKR
jgi:hypothetical protein